MPISSTTRDDLRLEGFDEGHARRIRQTVSCTDCDELPKVADAGLVRERDGVRVQVMHNGVEVVHGGYFGDWMAEIIRVLRGHHEPQEERVFDTAVRRLREEVEAGGAPPKMVEVGAYWAYYSNWFCREIPGARAYGIEPDPAFLEVGHRNVALNGLQDRIVLEPGVVGGAPGTPMEFVAESDGKSRAVMQHDLASLMDRHGLERVDLALVDIQGWELVLLERALPLMRAGAVRFLVVSTHHHSISGDVLTHQKVRDLLVDAGAIVLADHTVSESASGDGLVAVSFDPRDRDLQVPISHVRARDSLFGEVEYDLNHAHHLLAQVEAERDELRQQVRRLRRRVRRLRAQRAGLGAATHASPAQPLATRAASRIRRLLNS